MEISWRPISDQLAFCEIFALYMALYALWQSAADRRLVEWGYKQGPGSDSDFAPLQCQATPEPIHNDLVHWHILNVTKDFSTNMG